MKKNFYLNFCLALLFAMITLVSCDGGSSGSSAGGGNDTGITVDGAIDSDYGSAYSTGYGDAWGAKIESVYVTSDDDKLYICADFNPAESGNNVFFFVDAVSQTTGGDSFEDFGGNAAFDEEDGCFNGMGYMFISDNSISATMEWVAAGDRWDDAAGAGSDVLDLTKERSILDKDGASATDRFINRDAAQTLVLAQDSTEGIYEVSVPYSSIGTGVSAGDKVKVYVMFGNFGKMFSIAPAQSEDISDGGSNGLTTLDQEAPEYTLN